MFSNRQQSIPKVFIEKMQIDNEIEEVASRNIIGMDEMAKLRRKRDWLRDDCARLLQRSKPADSGVLA